MNKKNVNLYKDLYSKQKNYSRNLNPMYRIISSYINFKYNTFLDYGCGEGNLAEIFERINKCKVFKYDPAIERYAKMDMGLKVDLIVNCDVMEHIPQDEVDSIFLDMSKISKNVFFNIHLAKAKTILPNGENAHCTIKPKEWWRSKINNYFKTADIVMSSYPNSVSIITWKISYVEKIQAFKNIVLNKIENLIYFVRFKLLK